MKNLENNNDHIESLIHTYLSGSISQKDKDELFIWLVKNPSNVSYFNQISDIWLSSSVFQDIHKFDEDDAFRRVKNKINYVNSNLNKERRKTISLTWLKAAAILIPIIILSGLATRLIFNKEPAYSEVPFQFEVPYGAKATIVLPDSSKVVLNAGSKLTCREGFGKSHRLLNLIGEGYFIVAKNKDLPFIVRAGNLNVKALGTEFNVKAYPEDKNIEAILIHGSIQINRSNNNGSKEIPLILKPKQSLVYIKNADRFQLNVSVEKTALNNDELPILTDAPEVVVKQTEIDPTIYTTWKEGSWIIYQMDLSDLAIELERRFDVDINLGSETMKKIKVTGTLPDISLEQVLSAIRLISPIEYKINGRKVELTENENLIPLYKKYYRNTDN